MDLVLLLIYVYLGYKANIYLRVHLLHQTAVFYSDTMGFYMQQFVYALFLGWIFIPLAIIVWLFCGRSGN